VVDIVKSPSNHAGAKHWVLFDTENTVLVDLPSHHVSIKQVDMRTREIGVK
jgi:hypothetical protein